MRGEPGSVPERRLLSGMCDFEGILWPSLPQIWDFQIDFRVLEPSNNEVDGTLRRRKLRGKKWVNLENCTEIQLQVRLGSSVFRKQKRTDEILGWTDPEISDCGRWLQAGGWGAIWLGPAGEDSCSFESWKLKGGRGGGESRLLLGAQGKRDAESLGNACESVNRGEGPKAEGESFHAVHLWLWFCFFVFRQARKQTEGEPGPAKLKPRRWAVF